MAKVRLGKELAVTVVNKIGVLADMSKILAAEKINIEAVAGYADVNNQAKIMLVTDNNGRALEVLKKNNYNNIREAEVVILDLDNEPGTLKDITAKLGLQNIDIKYIYGTACSAGCPAKIILSTIDNTKAASALK